MRYQLRLSIKNPSNCSLHSYLQVGGFLTYAANANSAFQLSQRFNDNIEGECKCQCEVVEVEE